jgi:hypothetical protein
MFYAQIKATKLINIKHSNKFALNFTISHISMLEDKLYETIFNLAFQLLENSHIFEISDLHLVRIESVEASDCSSVSKVHLPTSKTFTT